MKYRSKPTEVEAMQWTPDAWDDPEKNATDIVAWVNANGGEARYETHSIGAVHFDPLDRIAVRTINGWAYAAPGHYVVMGSERFDTGELTPEGEPIELLDHYPCDPETFEKRRESYE